MDLVVGSLAGSIDVMMGNDHKFIGNATTLVEGMTRQIPIVTQLQYRAGKRPEVPNLNPSDYATFETAISDVTGFAYGLTPWLEGEEGAAIASYVLGERPDPGPTGPRAGRSGRTADVSGDKGLNSRAFTSETRELGLESVVFSSQPEEQKDLDTTRCGFHQRALPI